MDVPKRVSLPVAEKWYGAGLRFNCTQCGNCCSGGPGYVWLTVNDMQRIAQFLVWELVVVWGVGHPRVGCVCCLLFQGVVVVFCGMVVVTIGGVMRGVFPNTAEGLGRALLWGMYLSMPIALAGAIAGVMAVLQE